MLHCPQCGTELELLSTTNEWRRYCPKCDLRFNDKLERCDGEVPQETGRG